MKLNATFQGKQPAMEEAPCEVGKVICLTDKEYAFFKKHLMYEYDFLRKNADGMGFRNGIRQCVLVMGETSEDGVLVMQLEQRRLLIRVRNIDDLEKIYKLLVSTQ